MRHFLPELIALPLLPFLITQGRRTRRLTPRLPEAAGPCDGIALAGNTTAPLRLLCIGESPVAGVGVANHHEAITGQLAHALAARWQRPVAWRACGKNGVTVREALVQVLPAVPCEQVDIALVAFGVNDTTAFRSVSAWRADLTRLLCALDERCAPRLTLLSGLPPIGQFPALPQPLAWVMGLKAAVLDAAARQLAAARPRTRYVALDISTTDSALMADDGYHPSAKGCAAWAEVLSAACTMENASPAAQTS